MAKAVCQVNYTQYLFNQIIIKLNKIKTKFIAKKKKKFVTNSLLTTTIGKYKDFLKIFYKNSSEKRKKKEKKRKNLYNKH